MNTEELPPPEPEEQPTHKVRHECCEDSGETDCESSKRVVRPGKDALIRRMNRIQGQAGGISRMVEEDRYCVDILMQISAIKSALDGVAMQILDSHIRNCVRHAVRHEEDDEIITELLTVIRKYGNHS